MSNTEYQSSFFVVPSRILNLPGLTLAFLRIYETIFQFWNHGKNCYLSNQSIQERTGISSESTIREAFAFFEIHGELKRKKVGNRRYLIQPERKIEIKEQKKDSTKTVQGVDLATVDRRNSDGQGVDLATHNNKKINTKKLNKRYCANAQKRFDEFWYLYPRKKDKHRSMKIWSSKELDDIADKILDDIKNRLLNDEQWKNEKFIPHPSTYLKNSRWEDEITLSSKKEMKAKSDKPGSVESVVNMAQSLNLRSL